MQLKVYLIVCINGYLMESVIFFEIDKVEMHSFVDNEEMCWQFSLESEIGFILGQ